MTQFQVFLSSDTARKFLQSSAPTTLATDVIKDVKENEALYAKILTFRTLVNEIQARAPEGMKYNILLTSKETETTLEQVLHSRGRCGTTPQQSETYVIRHILNIRYMSYFIMIVFC